VPYFSFGEKLAVLEQGTTDPAGLGYAYETLATLLANNMESVQELKTSRGKLVEDTYAHGSNMWRVLFLPANPYRTSRVTFASEVRAIEEELRSSKYRERFEVMTRWVTRPSDLSQLLLEVRANVVHFSGYGSNSKTIEIALEDSRGVESHVSGDNLGALLALSRENIQCVVLDACYSARQAKSIAEHVPFVIGMRSGIDDERALAFSTGFYQALAAGRTIEDAFHLGSAQLGLQGEPTLSPILIRNEQSVNRPEPNRLLVSLYPDQPIGIRAVGEWAFSARTQSVFRLNIQSYKQEIDRIRMHQHFRPPYDERNRD